MRNFFALIGLLVVGFLGAGWYLGWYKLSFSRNPDGSAQVKADVNTRKVTADTGEGMKQVGAFLNSQAQKAGDGKAGPLANTPGPVTPPQISAPGANAPAPAPGTNATNPTMLGFDFSQ